MDSNSTSYNHNLTYRYQKQFIEEHLMKNTNQKQDHKLFQNFPLRNDDPDVESEILSSRRNSWIGKDHSNFLGKKDNLGINMSVISGIKKQDTNKSMNRSQIFQGQASQRLPYVSPMTRAQTNNNMEASVLNTNVEEGESKVVPTKLMKVLMLLVNVQHFFRQLTNNTRIFNKLTYQQHRLIGDIVSDYRKNTINRGKYSKIISNIFYQLFFIMRITRIPIFEPSSKLIKAWDTLLSFLIVICTFLLNLQLFFMMDIEPFRILFEILFIFSVIDIFVELNTGVVQKGTVNYKRKYIVKHYIKKILIFDFIANIPLFTLIFNINMTMKLQVIVDILFTFKWVKIKKVFSQISFYLSYEKNNKNMYDLIRLLFFIIGVCHVFCIFWHGVAVYEINIGKTNSWLHAKNLVESGIFERYIYSFYYLAVTMITVGYGDITPQNPLEIGFTILTMFCTGIVYAFSLNTIGSIIDNIEKKDKKYKESMQIIHGLMRDENVSRELRIKVSNYIEYLYKVITLKFKFNLIFKFINYINSI